MPSRAEGDKPGSTACPSKTATVWNKAPTPPRPPAPPPTPRPPTTGDLERPRGGDQEYQEMKPKRKLKMRMSKTYLGWVLLVPLGP